MIDLILICDFSSSIHGRLARTRAGLESSSHGLSFVIADRWIAGLLSADC